MTRTPIDATVVVLLFALAVPVWLTARLATGSFAPKASDAVLVVALVAWLLISKAILDRSEPVPPLANHRYSPRWQARSLVDQSLLGVGFEGNKTSVESRLHLLSAPLANITDQLAPNRAVSKVEWSREGLGDEEAGPRAIPVLHANEAERPVILATEEYIVARRDTFWSIAEAVLDDGRLWTSIQELNIGREVAPDVILGADDELHIGWSILIPLVSSDDDSVDEG